TLPQMYSKTMARPSPPLSLPTTHRGRPTEQPWVTAHGAIVVALQGLNAQVAFANLDSVPTVQHGRNSGPEWPPKHEPSCSVGSDRVQSTYPSLTCSMTQSILAPTSSMRL